MNQTICPIKYVASWILCVLVFVFLPHNVFAQTAFPPLTPVNVSSFTIPFELADSAETLREVELLVSKDRGKHWYSAAKQPVATKKFTFHADSNGEYWFAFRTITLSGTMSPLNGYPQLRVLVETKVPMVVVSPKQSESGPLIPPKPMRFREGTSLQPAKTDKPLPQADKSVNTDAENTNFGNVNTDSTNSGNAGTETPAEPFLGPKLPGFELSSPGTNSDADVLENLLSRMDSFLDVHPVAVKSVPNNPVTVDKTSPKSNDSASTPPGGIVGIFLSNTPSKPQIFVRWNTGAEPWQDAQIDILRSRTKEGQWSPIAINLPNNGEYWWYLTQEDLKPFYISVRIRSLRGGINGDVTQTAITIDPQISLPKSASL